MRFGRTAIGVALMLAACGSEEGVFVEPLEANVVYGTDDRLEVYAHPDASLRQIALESIVALIPAARLSPGVGGEYVLEASTLQSQRQVCEDELFSNQPVAATCSGVLIAKDLILTAGHCVGPSRPCDVFDYVFNYRWEADDSLAPILESDVYSCERIVLDPSAGNALTPDFAIIQLDRPVTSDHVPARVRAADPLEVGDWLAMIGSGSGLPAKIDSGAWVAEADADELDYYVVNLDAFEGHSGSATFDDESRLAGILIGGRVPDYVPDSERSCMRVNRFEDSLAGEIVHNIAPIIYALCQAGEGGDELCGDQACDGEPCAAPPVAKAPSEPTNPGGDVEPASSGCSVSTSSSAPAASLAAIVLGMLVARVRRKAV